MLATIGNSVPNLLFAKDRDGRLLYANPAVLALIGRREDDYRGLLDSEFLADPAEAAAVMAADQDIMASGESRVVDEQVTDPAGITRTYRSTKTPLRDAGGNVVGMAGVTIDMTEQLEAERLLRKSEARFRGLSDALPALIFLTDADGDALFTNRVLQDYLGVDAAAMPPRAWREAVHPGDARLVAHCWRDAVADRKIFECRYRLRRHDGAFRWFQLRCLPILSDTGDLRQWVGAGTDTQELVDARDALEAANDDLEARVAERTATLQAALDQLSREQAERLAAEAQVRQMQKMESLGQLTGGIAHDFNNMLGIVIGSLDLARRRLESDPEKARKGIDYAEEGARRAAELTQRLLAFSCQQPLAPQPLALNRLVGDMSALLQRTLGEGVRIETVLAAGLWQCFIDAAELENALVNLCVNARDAMPGGGRLTIETANMQLDELYADGHAEVTPGQYVMVAVTDTGSGMAPDVVARAFDPFFTTKPVGSGTGLGLSQVYGFVRQSGGHVKIYSEPGHGTTVRLYLPRHHGDAEVAPAPAAPALLPRARGTEIVLVVEDDDGVRRITADSLEELGYQVRLAAHAEAALALLAGDGRIDLLLTDIVMPGINGRELAARAATLRPALPVLFVTGYTSNAVVHNGMLDPGVAFLAKPFTLTALAAKVRAVLDGAGANR